jgi:hypothetical protein
MKQLGISECDRLHIFCRGLLETVITAENPEWFLMIPYHLTRARRQRAWYIKELQKAQTTEELKLTKKKKKK